jgi:hypothetical protein
VSKGATHPTKSPSRDASYCLGQPLEKCIFHWPTLSSGGSQPGSKDFARRGFGNGPLIQNSRDSIGPFHGLTTAPPVTRLPLISPVCHTLLVLLSVPTDRFEGDVLEPRR